MKKMKNLDSIPLEIAGKLFDIDRSDMTTAEEQIAQILVETGPALIILV